MIYTEHQLKEMIIEMIDNFENEVVEFKEARTNYSFKDIGKYFSALGNEANIRGKREGWLIFGVANNKDIVGTSYRNDGGLQNLINRVKVTLYGKILDRNYTELLHANGNLDLRKVFLLDLIQKKETISKADYLTLKKEKLVEGRYPHIYVSYNVANLVGHKEDYVLNRGLKNDVYRQMILNALETMGEATVLELRTVLVGTFPSHMDEKQQSRKVSNILQVMKKAC